VKPEVADFFHPHLASPIKGEEQRYDCEDCLNLMRMGVFPPLPHQGGGQEGVCDLP
jgi:hypothetical protein